MWARVGALGRFFLLGARSRRLVAHVRSSTDETVRVRPRREKSTLLLLCTTPNPTDFIDDKRQAAALGVGVGGRGGGGELVGDTGRDSGDDEGRGWLRLGGRGWSANSLARALGCRCARAGWEWLCCQQFGALAQAGHRLVMLRQESKHKASLAEAGNGPVLAGQASE